MSDLSSLSQTLLQLQARIYSPSTRSKCMRSQSWRAACIACGAAGVDSSFLPLSLLAFLTCPSLYSFLWLSLPSSPPPVSHRSLFPGLLCRSLPPSLLSIRLPSRISNLFINSPLLLPFSELLIITPLLSPPVLTGTILHSAAALAGLHYCVCAARRFPLAHIHTHARSLPWMI